MTNYRRQNKNKFRRTSDQLKLEEFLTKYMLENSDRMIEDIKLITDPNVSETEKIQLWLSKEIGKVATKRRAAAFLQGVGNALIAEQAQPKPEAKREFHGDRSELMVHGGGIRGQSLDRDILEGKSIIGYDDAERAVMQQRLANF